MAVGRSLLKEVQLIRYEIRVGRFERTMAFLTACAALASGWEAYVQHLRGAFSNWLMWTPVWLTPPTVVAGLLAIFSKRMAKTVLPVLAVISLIDGLIGFGMHVRGIARLPGGFHLGQYNVVMGPPIFAPLLTCTTGIMGLLAAFLRRETYEPRPSHGRLVDLLDDLFEEAVVRARPQRSARRVRAGQFQRVMACIVALLAALTGGEAYFEHMRGSFNRRLMWTPIWVTPALVIAGLGAVVSQRLATYVLPVASFITFVNGALGFGLHLQGIRRMPGGFHNLLFNVTLGPPLFAPLLFCSVALLGFIASLSQRRKGRLR